MSRREQPQTTGCAPHIASSGLRDGSASLIGSKMVNAWKSVLLLFTFHEVPPANISTEVYVPFSAPPTICPKSPSLFSFPSFPSPHHAAGNEGPMGLLGTPETCNHLSSRDLSGVCGTHSHTWLCGHAHGEHLGFIRNCRHPHGEPGAVRTPAGPSGGAEARREGLTWGSASFGTAAPG